MLQSHTIREAPGVLLALLCDLLPVVSHRGTLLTSADPKPKTLGFRVEGLGLEDDVEDRFCGLWITYRPLSNIRWFSVNLRPK